MAKQKKKSKRPANARTDFECSDKRSWRRLVWNGMRKWLRTLGKNPKRANVIMLPGRSDDEIEICISKGFRQGRIHAIDFKPAVVAHRKRSFPAIHTYGKSLARAAWQIASEGVRIDAASLDLTGNFGPQTFYEIASLLMSGAVGPGSVLAVNMFRGREKDWYSEFSVWASQSAKKLHTGESDRWNVHWMRCPHLGEKREDRDLGRLLALDFMLYACGYIACPIRTGIYKSVMNERRGRMIWAVVGIDHHIDDDDDLLPPKSPETEMDTLVSRVLLFFESIHQMLRLKPGECGTAEELRQRLEEVASKRHRKDARYALAEMDAVLSPLMTNGENEEQRPSLFSRFLSMFRKKPEPESFVIPLRKTPKFRYALPDVEKLTVDAVYDDEEWERCFRD